MLDNSIWTEVNVARAHIVAFLNERIFTGRNFVDIESIFFVHVVHRRLCTEACGCTFTLAHTRNTVVYFPLYCQVALRRPRSKVCRLFETTMDLEIFYPKLQVKTAISWSSKNTPKIGRSPSFGSKVCLGAFRPYSQPLYGRKTN